MMINSKALSDEILEGISGGADTNGGENVLVKDMRCPICYRESNGEKKTCQIEIHSGGRNYCRDGKHWVEM